MRGLRAWALFVHAGPEITTSYSHSEGFKRVPVWLMSISRRCGGRQYLATAQRRRQWSSAMMASASGGWHADYEGHSGPFALPRRI
jgi:hypothetical protein